MSFGGMEDFPLEMPGIARVTGPTYFGQTMEQGLNPSLQATSYSDVLASFAAEWPQPAPANNVATTWPEPGTLLDRSSMEHGSRQESLHAGSLGSPTVDFLAGSMAMDAGSAHGGTFFSQVSCVLELPLPWHIQLKSVRVRPKHKLQGGR